MFRAVRFDVFNGMNSGYRQQCILVELVQILRIKPIIRNRLVVVR